LVAGLVSGLLGVGGGVVLVPSFVAAFGMGQRRAVAGSLVAIIPISVVGVLTYWLFGSAHEVRFDLGVALAAGSIVGARYGAQLTRRVSERTLAIAFAILLLIVAVRLLLPGLPAASRPATGLNAAEVGEALVVGLLAGVISGSLGVGGGVVMVPAMVLLAGLSQAAAQGTSLLVIIPTALSGAYTHWRDGQIEEPRVILSGLVGAVTAFLGAILALNIDGTRLRQIFALYLLYVSYRTLRRTLA
jgi:uncharacterized membrane protein YfcA